MRVYFLTGFLLASFIAFSQKKSELKINSAKIMGDSLYVNYCIENRSSEPILFFVPQISDIKYHFFELKVVVNKKKSILYRVLNFGDLDKLAIIKDAFVVINQYQNSNFTLSADLNGFYSKHNLVGKTLVFSIFTYDGLINCPDCEHNILDEYHTGEIKIEKKS